MKSANFLRVFTALFALFTTVHAKHVGWHDPNIVCCDPDGGWIRVPKEVYGSPPPITHDLWKRNDSSTIVLIAALRETRLVDTLYSMFSNAAHPDHVVAGVVQQNAPTDVDCLEELCAKFGTPVVRRPHAITAAEAESAEEAERIRSQGVGGSYHLFQNPNGCRYFDQLRVYRMDASEAAGPVYARGKGTELVEEEDFCMQIDAHTVFKKDWDVLFKREWAATENEYGVLTTYPTNYKDMNKNTNRHWEMPHLCAASLRPGSPIVANGQAKACANLDRPLLAPLWAAGLSYSRCHAEKTVPNDPNLKQIFQGEEFARGARLWTHGYDFYSITRPLIGTYYGSEKGGKGGWRGNSAESRASSARMATLLQAPGSDQSQEAHDRLSPYTLGEKRTLEQYFEFSGVNVAKGTTNMNCIVSYVPWWWPETQVPRLRGNVDAEIPPPSIRQPVEKQGLIDDQGAEETSHLQVQEQQPSSEGVSFFVLYAVVILILLLSFFALVCCNTNRKPLWFRNRKRVQRAVAASKYSRNRKSGLL